MPEDREIRELLASGLDDTERVSAERVNHVVTRTRRHVAARDLVVLFFGRIWGVLAVLMAPLFVRIQKAPASRTRKRETDKRRRSPSARATRRP